MDPSHLPGALATFTADLADELALTYDDHVVFPRRVVIDQPGAPESHFPGWSTPVLLLALENQGVCAWGVPLDGHDNPPVLVGVEPTATVRYAADVDAYITARRWDHACLSSGLLLQAQALPIDRASLTRLRSRYDELPSTYGWPGDVSYRFQSAGVQIMLWAVPDQCDWWISGTDADQLAETTTALLPYSDLRSSLWSNHLAGQALVDRLRTT